jgi:hypothetical protein
MRQNDAVLVVYVPSRTGEPLGPTFTAGQVAGAGDRPQGTPPNSLPKGPVLCLQYVDRMTQDEMRAAVDQLLAKNAPTDLLIRFERYWSADQSRRILQSLRARPVRTPQTSLALADLYHRLKQDDDARRELLHTRILLRTIAQPSDLEGRVRSLAKDLGDEKLAEKPIEPRALAEAGFVELKAGIQVPSREIGAEEPVHFYVKNPKGSPRIISVRVVKSDADGVEPTHQLAFVDSSEHGRSSGTGGTSYGFVADDGFRVTFVVDRVGKEERYRLNTQLSGR